MSSDGARQGALFVRLFSCEASGHVPIGQTPIKEG